MATMKTLNGYGFNATELNGKAASDYLQKTDTASDTSKLGGKAPEYYIQPRNLLDNSDFRNPVNQRGVSSVTTTGYTIDRWFLQNTGDGISISDDGVTFNATNSLIVFLQKINKEIRKVLIGKTITVAATDSSGNVGIGTCVVPNFGEGVDSAQNSIGDTGLKVNIYTRSTDDILHIRLLTDSILSPVTIVNIALYEGSYTADTLPPYVPKGYATELAACNSAPVDLDGGCGGGSLQAYPVGAVYISANSTSPASLFGGTWESIGGRFLLAADSTYTAGSTGGTSKNVLDTTSIPHIGTGIKYVGSGGTFSLPSGVNYKEEWLGGGTTTNLDNMPPYLAVYMWKRVS